MADEGKFLAESAGQLQPEKPKPAEEAEQAVVQEAIEFLAFVRSYEDAQRKAEDEEAEFADLDMWDPDSRSARAEHTDEDGTKIPAKPTISAPLHDPHVQQIVNEARQARLALTVKPKAGIANTKTSDYCKGLVRKIQASSGHLSIRIWSLERTAKVGRGAYRIDAEYADDGDFDLDLVLKRILDQGTVYLDPFAQAADYRDGERALITDVMSERERKRRWPDKPIVAPDGAFDDPNGIWFQGDGADPNNNKVRVGAFYKLIHKPRILGFHPAFGRGWLEGEADKSIQVMPPDMAEAVRRKAPGTRTREVDVPTVTIYVVDGTQILEERPWLGRYIPIVPVIGKEAFVKGKRRYSGAIANTIGLLRAINVTISAATEVAAMMPRSAYIMYAGQDDNFTNEWDELYIANRTRVHVNQVDVDGKPAPLPQRQQMEIQVQGLMFLLRMLTEMFHAVTGSVAASARAVDPYDRSGKAIDLLQRQGAAGTSNYLDNLATISMPYEGIVLIDAIPHYYDKPGRVLRVVGENDDDETAIMIKTPFVRDPDGNPIPVPCQTCQGAGIQKPSRFNPFAAPSVCPACEGSKQATRETMPETWNEQEVEYVDFGEVQYEVEPVVDRNYQVKQEEALAGMTQLAQAAPELVPAYAATWVRAMGFSGSNVVADAIDAAFPPPGKEFGDQKVPPQFLAQYGQLKQRHDQAMLALQETQKLLETDAIKQAGQTERDMIKAGLQEKLEKIRQQGKIIELGAGQTADAQLEVLRGKIEMMQQEAQHRHEILLELLKEQKDKEIERHSVELHEAAAAKAADRADLSATLADVRKADMAASADGRKDQSAAKADTRKDTLSARADARGEQSAERADARADQSAEKADARAESAAERAAARDQKDTQE